MKIIENKVERDYKRRYIELQETIRDYERLYIELQENIRDYI